MSSYTSLGENRYKIYVELGYNDKGKRIRKTKTINAKSDRALKKAITDFEIEVRQKADVEDVENITFDGFKERFFKLYVEKKLSIRSRDTYLSYYNSSIGDYFGDMKINKIKPLHIEEFFNNEVENGKKSLTGKYLLLKSIFSKAVDWEVITNNPMAKISPPIKNKRYKEISFYTDKQIKLLLDTLNNQKVNYKLKMQIKLALFGGLRKSEIAGLRIESFDYENKGLLIDKTLQYDKLTKKFLLGNTKTKKSRFVILPDEILDEMKIYIREQKKLKLRMGNLWKPIIVNEKPVELIFTKENGQPTHLNTISNEWVKFLNRYKLPKLNFHGLRHTHASYLLSEGANYKTIQEQLGHADIKETINTYSHITKDFKREEINVFSKLF